MSRARLTFSPPTARFLYSLQAVGGCSPLCLLGSTAPCQPGNTEALCVCMCLFICKRPSWTNPDLTTNQTKKHSAHFIFIYGITLRHHFIFFLCCAHMLLFTHLFYFHKLLLITFYGCLHLLVSSSSGLSLFTTALPCTVTILLHFPTTGDQVTVIPIFKKSISYLVHTFCIK